MIRVSFAFFALLLATASSAATEAGWALVRDGGQAVLLRHARVSGAGEPTGFDIANCRTQRNLSEQGRSQARRIGALFAARAAPIERVLSSRACRALDTATLAFEDNKPEPFPALDPSDGDGEAAKARTAAVKAEIGRFTGTGNLLLVTDGENIQALTGVMPREGEALIVRLEGDAVHVLARIVFN